MPEDKIFRAGGEEANKLKYEQAVMDSKAAQAAAELTEELGVDFAEKDPATAAEMVDKRIKDNDEKLLKEIEKLTL